MAKRYRDFLRVNMTAKTATFIREKVVDSTFDDHYAKCADDPDCHHIESGNLDVAREVEAGIKIGKKRATLDLACPYSQSDPPKQAKLLENVANRIFSFADGAKKRQLIAACTRVAREIEIYAHRNAMEVLAEASLL
jgi:hypothetical protein